VAMRALKSALLSEKQLNGSVGPVAGHGNQSNLENQTHSGDTAVPPRKSFRALINVGTPTLQIQIGCLV
jgi:hypothetical protein